ncbi:SRPBCC domain-containing protein [Pontibacter locisalis]|uniref:SRPBCC domain-containing protein n=1 Tax=Pontibacter locisalis TaxID=1719035 RepID=A0ABW5IP21_9BACT
MANIYHQVLIHASCATVYEAITTQKGLSEWWIADCKVKPEVGFVNEFHTEGHANVYMKVLTLQPDSFVKWEGVESGDAWTGTHVTFALSEKSDFTCLDFKHTGYADEDELYATCNYHWARHLYMLKVLCETGFTLLDRKQEAKECLAVSVSREQV